MATNSQKTENTSQLALQVSEEQSNLKATTNHFSHHSSSESNDAGHDLTFGSLLIDQDTLSLSPLLNFVKTFDSSEANLLNIKDSLHSGSTSGQFKTIKIPAELLSVQNFNFLQASLSISTLLSSPTIKTLEIQGFHPDSPKIVKRTWEAGFFKLIKLANNLQLNSLHLFKLPLPNQSNLDFSTGRKRRRTENSTAAEENEQNLSKILNSLQTLQINHVGKKALLFLTKSLNVPGSFKIRINELNSELTNSFLNFYYPQKFEWDIQNARLSVPGGLCPHLTRQFFSTIAPTLTSLDLTFETFTRTSSKCFSCKVDCSNFETSSPANFSYLPNFLDTLKRLTLCKSTRVTPNDPFNSTTIYRHVLKAMTYPKLTHLFVEHNEEEKESGKEEVQILLQEISSRGQVVTCQSLRHVTLRCNNTLLLTMDQEANLWPGVTSVSLENPFPGLLTQFLSLAPKSIKKLKLVWDEPWAAGSDMNWDAVLAGEDGPSIRDLSELKKLEMNLDLRSRFPIGLTDTVLTRGIAELKNLRQVTLRGVQITKEAAEQYRDKASPQTRLFLWTRGYIRKIDGIKSGKGLRRFYVHPHPNLRSKVTWRDRKPKLGNPLPVSQSRMTVDTVMIKVKTRRQRRRELDGKEGKAKFGGRKERRNLGYEFHENRYKGTDNLKEEYSDALDEPIIIIDGFVLMSCGCVDFGP